jgi:hypothetical protein
MTDLYKDDGLWLHTAKAPPSIHSSLLLHRAALGPFCALPRCSMSELKPAAGNAKVMKPDEVSWKL